MNYRGENIFIPATTDDKTTIVMSNTFNRKKMISREKKNSAQTVFSSTNIKTKDQTLYPAFRKLLEN